MMIVSVSVFFIILANEKNKDSERLENLQYKKNVDRQKLAEKLKNIKNTDL